MHCISCSRVAIAHGFSQRTGGEFGDPGMAHALQMLLRGVALHPLHDPVRLRRVELRHFAILPNDLTLLEVRETIELVFRGKAA